MPGIPLQSDRSAWDVDGYPALHASDLPSAPVHHVPAGDSIGDLLQWDGSKWTSSSISAIITVPPIMTLGTMEGTLEISDSPLRIYNRYQMNRSFIEVFLAVDTPPDGDDIVVDVQVNGVSIFDTGSEPKILDGENTGYVTIFDIPTWTAGTYLTWSILQVGSSTPGSNLVVHIVHEQSVGGS